MGQRTQGVSTQIEFCYNKIWTPVPSGPAIDTGLVYNWSTGTWTEEDRPYVYVYRNTIVGTLRGLTNSGPYTVYEENNVVLNNYNPVIEGSSDNRTIISADNLTGTRTSGILDANYNLAESYSAYLGTHGAEISSSQPLLAISGLVPAMNTKFAKTTTQVSVEITTDKAATCRFGGTPGITWGSLNQYDTTGTTAHSETLSVVAGGVYQVCSRCLDTATQQYSTDSCTSFSIDAKPKSWWWR
jgi:hypothetical protein